MKRMTLHRVSYMDHATFGVLLDDDLLPFAVTLERPWLNNAQNTSCIPVGTYVCRRVVSPRFGDTFEVDAVRGRSHILFHVGNRDEETEGCILVAEEFGELGAEAAVLRSRKGFDEFMARLKGHDAFRLNLTYRAVQR